MRGTIVKALRNILSVSAVSATGYSPIMKFAVFGLRCEL